MTTIDDLTRGQTVVLRFYDSRDFGKPPYTETAKFKGVIGRGEDRRAVFESRDGDRAYTWNVYRFEGEWAYGSSAEPLRLVRVLDEAAA